MESPEHHPPKEVPPVVMVLSRPVGHQHRYSLPHFHSEDQSRPAGERHPQEANSLCLSELARAYPVPEQRRVASPKHCLLHRLKRLWRFADNDRVNALEVQLAFVAHTLARVGFPRLVGLAIDWTMFDTVMPSGQRIRYQVLRIAIPRKGRALPLLQLAYDRDHLPPQRSQNQLEQDALGWRWSKPCPRA